MPSWKQHPQQVQLRQPQQQVRVGQCESLARASCVPQAAGLGWADRGYVFVWQGQPRYLLRCWRPSNLAVLYTVLSVRPHISLSSCVLMQVLDFELQKQLVPYMKEVVPLPGAWGCSSVVPAIGFEHQFQYVVWHPHAADASTASCTCCFVSSWRVRRDLPAPLPSTRCPAWGG